MFYKKSFFLLNTANPEIFEFKVQVIAGRHWIIFCGKGVPDTKTLHLKLTKFVRTKIAADNCVDNMLPVEDKQRKDTFGNSACMLMLSIRDATLKNHLKSIEKISQNLILHKYTMYLK